jgi:hypothetical protein
MWPSLSLPSIWIAAAGGAFISEIIFEIVFAVRFVCAASVDSTVAASADNTVAVAAAAAAEAALHPFFLEAIELFFFVFGIFEVVVVVEIKLRNCEKYTPK